MATVSTNFDRRFYQFVPLMLNPTHEMTMALRAFILAGEQDDYYYYEPSTAKIYKTTWDGYFHTCIFDTNTGTFTKEKGWEILDTLELIIIERHTQILY